MKDNSLYMLEEILRLQHMNLKKKYSRSRSMLVSKLITKNSGSLVE